MLWFIFAAMAAIAVVFNVRPLLKSSQGLSVVILLLTVMLSGGLYAYIGSPGTPSGPGRGGDALPGMEEMIEQLTARLEQEPDDLEGWMMLGRSHMQIGQFRAAVDAFQAAVDLESGQNAQSLVELGEAYIALNNQQLTEREMAIFENAVRIDPDHQAALFYSGIGAANRGETELAAERWERLLNSQPPPNAEVMHILTQRIAEWRGTPATTPDPLVQANARPEPEAPDPVSAPVVESEAEPEPAPVGGIRVTVALSEAARSALPPNAPVFVIARDPAQPSPPIAVQRRVLSELPTDITLTDRDSMVPGRNISGFSEIEIVARVSTTGQPFQQPGDWFGSSVVELNGGAVLDILINEQVQ
ncbi:MAG: tetratricopeptide repeat protein [Woeseiaceae bacterium]|jgi:cytochrome c-type biogenesis protein CcmH|nr:tetratricopeptide repeat protein [Woeseiaceae bacterium]